MDENTIRSSGTPSVYIILLNWHGWRDTLLCIESLQHLDFLNFKIVVVDNCSTDDSVMRIRAAWPDIELIENDSNLGFSGGCNVGMRLALARGADYVWLLNNDTTVETRTLSAMVDVAESDPRIGGVGSVLHPMDHPDQVQAWGGGVVNMTTGRVKSLFSPGHVDVITGASFLLRCNALNTVGLLDEETFFMYWEDVDLSFRLRNSGWGLVVAPASHVLHKENASLGITNPKLITYLTKSSIHFFLKHSRYPLLPIAISIGGRVVRRFISGKFGEGLTVIRVVIGLTARH